MHDHVGRGAAAIVPSARVSGLAIPPLLRRGGTSRLDRSLAGPSPADRSQAQAQADRAQVLIEELRQHRARWADLTPPGGVLERPEVGEVPAGCVVSPAGEVVTAEMASWLQRTVRAKVLTPGYEAELARRMGPDLFGLLRLPDPPPFLAGINLADLNPAHIAPLLRRISLTRPAPAFEDLHPDALAADPGPVTAATRTPAQQRWAQPPGTPLLPQTITIPHLIHGIWLGTPLDPASNYATNFADTATRHQGHADTILWTDVPRTAFAAGTTPPPPPGHPDPHAPHRAMLTWARDNHIHLVNVHEIFHAAQPMTLHAQYTAETNKQLPRGYAGASDHLRLDIIHLLGGIYTDGDNHLTPHATPADLTTLLHDVTASDHAFTLHLLPDHSINNDVIIAPARHPAITMWRELTRASYTLTQAELFDGMKGLAIRYAGLPADLRWRRYTVTLRSARIQGALFKRLGLALDDARLVRVAPVITPGSQRSWADTTTAPPPVPLTAGQVTSRLTRAITTLARQLTSREGNLHLTAIAPLITTLPDPDVAWTATLTLLLEFKAALPAVTSITQFRWSDDVTPEYVVLPPEADALIDRAPAQDAWLGEPVAAPGHPAWLLDEAVVPGRLRAGLAELAREADAAGNNSTADALLSRRVRLARHARADRARELVERLRQELRAPGGQLPEEDKRPGHSVEPPAMPVGAADSVGAAGCVVSPTGEVVTAEMASWLQRTVRAKVLTPGYEAELARRMGPDLFGLLRLPSPPRFLRHIDLRTLLPEHIAPLLRRISLTQPAPAPQDLHPDNLATDPGPVTTTTRTPAQQRWAQLPGTPLLPAQITIPHLIHGIWLGTPLNPASNYAANIAAIARTLAGHADTILWTDIPRTAFAAADTTPPPPDSQPDPHAPHRNMLTWARQPASTSSTSTRSSTPPSP